MNTMIKKSVRKTWSYFVLALTPINRKGSINDLTFTKQLSK